MIKAKSEDTLNNAVNGVNNVIQSFYVKEVMTMTSKEMEYIQAETPKYVGELANVQISILSPTELEIVARERSAVEHAKDMIQRVRK